MKQEGVPYEDRQEVPAEVTSDETALSQITGSALPVNHVTTTMIGTIIGISGANVVTRSMSTRV
jgi:hypothetical protein